MNEKGNGKREKGRWMKEREEKITAGWRSEWKEEQMFAHSGLEYLSSVFLSLSLLLSFFLSFNLVFHLPLMSLTIWFFYPCLIFFFPSSFLFSLFLFFLPLCPLTPERERERERVSNSYFLFKEKGRNVLESLSVSREKEKTRRRRKRKKEECRRREREKGRNVLESLSLSREKEENKKKEKKKERRVSEKGEREQTQFWSQVCRSITTSCETRERSEVSFFWKLLPSSFNFFLQHISLYLYFFFFLFLSSIVSSHSFNNLFTTWVRVS